PAAYPASRARALVAQWTEHAPPKRGMQVRLLPGAFLRGFVSVLTTASAARRRTPSHGRTMPDPVRNGRRARRLRDGPLEFCVLRVKRVRLAVRDHERAGHAAAVRLDEDLAGVRRGSVAVAEAD